MDKEKENSTKPPILSPPERTMESKEGSLCQADFKTLANLGEGSFGRVYRALHLPTETEWAIKAISKDRLKSQSMISQMKKEVAIMMKAQHKNIVRLKTYFEDEQYINMVMELGGGNLYGKLIREKKFSEHTAGRVGFLVILSGL